MTAGTRIDDANVACSAFALAAPDARTDRFDVELAPARCDDRCDIHLFHPPTVDADAVQLEVLDQVCQFHTVYIYSNLHRWEC